ncbi:Six-hairpin glycosidase [Mycena chlorophos]|uniref:Six-hairpin glycosidase n=1 Tax=Mycena chlorophos TaxID=658473 RepID=A0A8H6TXA9_MYCCL|nr:Six-hairpin glycosidase [Mycena chlorophos]
MLRSSALSSLLLLRPLLAYGRSAQFLVDADNNIINNMNTRYTLNLTVAGTAVNVMLDTGSTDMWVAPPGGLVGATTDSKTFAEIAYGDGSNFVNGSVLWGEVDIAGYTIPQQAFINVLNSVGEEGDEASGIFGLVGLGFTGPDGSIPAALTAGGFNGTDVGKPVLSSIYAENPSKGQFFAFSLSRVGDVNDTADASLTISDYDPNYVAVANSPALPVYPPKGGRWSVVTDGITANGQTISWPSFDDSLNATGQNAVLFDTGTTNFLMPAAVRDAIYSTVPGAIVSRNSSISNLEFSEDNDVWVLPCNAIVNMTTIFANLEFPIHPLDLVDIGVFNAPDGNNYTACLGSVTNGGPILGPGLDALYGDSFLRNVYSVFSFGNSSMGPYVQLLADTDTDAAAADYLSVRAEQLAESPAEISPAAFISIYDGPNAVTSSVAGGPTGVVVTTTGAAPTLATTTTAVPTATGYTDGSAISSDKNLAADLDSSSSSNDSWGKWGPIIVGLLATNLLILLLVAFVSVMTYIRNGRKAGLPMSDKYAGAAHQRYVPVKLRDDSSFVPPAETLYDDEDHAHGRYSD